MPLPTPSDPLVNSVRVRQQTGMPFWQPPVIVMQTDLNPVTPNQLQAGWVSGSIASLAASATVDCIFDLGPDWDQYPILAVLVMQDGPSTGLNPVQILGSDTTTPDSRRRLSPAYAAGGNGASFSATMSTGAYVTMWVRPLGRFLTVRATNADGVNTAGVGSRVSVGMYPA